MENKPKKTSERSSKAHDEDISGLSEVDFQRIAILEQMDQPLKDAFLIGMSYRSAYMTASAIRQGERADAMSSVELKAVIECLDRLGISHALEFPKLPSVH